MALRTLFMHHISKPVATRICIIRHGEPDYDFVTGESLRGFVERVAEGIDWRVRLEMPDAAQAV